MVFLGQAEPLKIDVDAAQDRLLRPDYDKVRASLVDVDVHSLPDLLSVYTGNAADLDPWIRGAAINHDGDLRLSYLAGWGINSQIADSLYKQMLQYRHDPTWMLTGSQSVIDDVMKAIHAGPVE
jgi:hypothetical protein